MQRNEKHDKNLPHQPPWLGSGFGGPLWKATWLPVQVVQGGMHARAKDMTGPEYLLERALTKRFLRFAAFLAFLRLDFISFRNEVRSWVSFLISSWMTSWQQERTPKGGPDLGSISGTGTNGLTWPSQRAAQPLQGLEVRLRGVGGHPAVASQHYTRRSGRQALFALGRLIHKDPEGP